MKNGLTLFNVPVTLTRSCLSARCLPALLAVLLLVLLPASAPAQDDAVIGPDPGGQTAGIGPESPAGEHNAKALDFYHQGLSHFGNAKFHESKGNVAARKRLLKASVQAFEDALKEEPALVEAQSNIGFVYLTENNYGKAVKAFQKALAMNPNHLNTLNGLATAYAFEDDIAGAIRTFDQLTTLDPANTQFYFNKGAVLQKAGRFEEAQGAYQQALNINPEDQRTLFNLGTLKENQGQLQEALSYYQQAKGAEVGNTIGLEAINRVQAIEAELARREGEDATGTGGSEAAQAPEKARKSRKGIFK
ncbi:MAG: tetratricopeptide repeat protein [Candidatus Melainabacteria bacterium]